MKIKICDKNAERLEEVLEAGNGRRKAHTVSLTYLEDLAERAEEGLDELGLPLKLRKGSVATYNPSVHAGSYKYQYRTTLVRIERGVDSWFLNYVGTLQEWPNKSNKSYSSSITMAARYYLELKLSAKLENNPLI